MFYRRVIREYELLINNENTFFYNTLLDKIDNNNKITISMKLFSYHHNISFIFTRDYPFKAPIIYINNKLYTNILIYQKNNIKQNIYEKYFIDKNVCLCCSTMLCNWSPLNKIINILPEIKTNIEYIHRYIEILHAIKIKQKYLLDDINIESYL